MNFLIDIRIGNACKLLTKNNDLNITEISYKSGFNNLANFNRKFKSIKGVTPSDYRKKTTGPLTPEGGILIGKEKRIENREKRLNLKLTN